VLALLAEGKVEYGKGQQAVRQSAVVVSFYLPNDFVVSLDTAV